MSDEHRHQWEPVTVWFGRYRCVTCKCFGYRGVSVADVDAIGGPTSYHKPESIVPYKCSVKNCGKPAVRLRPKNKCREHDKERP